MTAPAAFWGPAFPDYGHAGPCFFGPAYPDCFQDPTVVVAPGLATAATFVLGWENLKLRLSWAADIIKSYSGLESRAQPSDFPTQGFSGAAQVALVDALLDHAALARYAAQGKPFLVGLPYEGIPVMSVAGPVLSVPTTTLSDWIVPGQRAIVTGSGAPVTAVIQSSTSGTITLDVSPGLSYVDNVMPGVPVFLDAQQSFQRYQAPGSLETWQVAARPIPFGYESGADLAAFCKLSTVTAGYFAGAFAVFNAVGTVGNGASLQLVADGFGAGTITLVGQAVAFHFQAGVTTIQQLLNALSTIGYYIQIYGALPSPLTALRSPQEVFTATLAGGSNKSWGTMGNGATVTTYASSPVWDRELQPGTDSIHSMAEILDLGGVPQQFQTASVPDWARAVNFGRMDPRQWQWFKAFLLAIRGQQVAFWLPTMRADLTPVTLTPGVLKVSTAGDFLAWWPGLRTQVRIETPDGTVRYAQVTAQVDNGDGTRSLTIVCSDAAYSAGGGGSSVVPRLVSWLDLCRLESPDVEVTWSEGMTFAFQMLARAVQR